MSSLTITSKERLELLAISNYITTLVFSTNGHLAWVNYPNLFQGYNIFLLSGNKITGEPIHKFIYEVLCFSLMGNLNITQTAVSKMILVNLFLMLQHLL